MRPISLHLAGFTTFKNATDIDFEGADLFALTGPTGSGKSSVIDAICFALYGSIPRLSGVAPVVSLGKPEARIRLVFAVEDQIYTVTRLVARQGDGASQRDVRLEGPDFVVSGVREVDARVESLLGLGFDHFTRTVVLPQGRFAAFLEDGPAAREKLLKQLLDLGVYEEMRKRGASHAVGLEGDLAVIDAQLHDLLVDPDQVAGAEARLDRLKALRGAIEESAATEEELTLGVREARQVRDRVSVDLERLDAVRPPDNLDDVAERLRTARVAFDQAQTAKQGAETALNTLVERRAELGELAALDGVIKTHGRVSEMRDRLFKGNEVVAEVRVKAVMAANALNDAEVALDSADKRARSAERAHAAHAIRIQLADGDECPVCLRAIPSVPDVDRPVDLETASREQAEAVRVRDAAADGLRVLDAELARLQGHLEQRTEELAAAEATASALAPLDEVRASKDRAVALDNEIAEARRAVVAAATGADECALVLERVEKAVAVAADALARGRDTLAGLAPPVPARVDAAEDWATLVSWVATRSTKLREQQIESDTVILGLEKQLETLRRSLLDEAREAGIEDPGGDVKVAVASAIATEEGTLVRMRADLEKKQALGEKRKAFEAERLRYDATAKLLRSNKFQQWLIEEALVGLVAFANAELEKLAGGAYSLAVDGGEFEVVDHRNAEARRSVKTLSGGETFLVSLALALALAERVVATSAIGTARIESMFLDEGFGTLDAETLDTVAAVVQELGSRDRMIGLVTHVRELAEQIPVRFEVKKLPNGSTVTRVEA
ncbi:MAG: SMC family ATPase [Acidimicrobiia bacterium]